MECSEPERLSHFYDRRKEVIREEKRGIQLITDEGRQRHVEKSNVQGIRSDDYEAATDRTNKSD